MPNALSVLAVLVFLLGVFSSGLAIGIKWEEGRIAIEEKTTKAAVDAALKVSAEAIANIKVTNKTIQGEVRHEVETHTVYADCKLTSGGLQLANQALAGSKPVSTLQLPRIDAPTK